MAKLKTPARLSAARIRKALEDGLTVAGIGAQIQIESVPGTRLHRVLVLAAGFSSLSHSERQQLTWRALEQQLTSDEQLQISMVLTLTPAELKGA